MKILMTFLSLCAAQVVFGQRLPDLQTKVINVPADVRIDGVDTEWGPEYGAKNRKLDISYSIANDKDFLYLVVKAEKDSKEYNKITTSGLQFSVNVDNKNDSEKAYKVSFPTRSASTGSTAGMATTVMTVVGGSMSGGSFTVSDRDGMMRRADSAMRANRTNRLNQAKEIKVFNFPAVTDSLISIYNEYDIKVAAKFTDKDEYIYEMAIPLSLMGLNATSAKEIAYQLRSNPIITRSISQEEIAKMIPAGALPPGASISFRGAAGEGGFNEALIPTEVWGKYKMNLLQ